MSIKFHNNLCILLINPPSDLVDDDRLEPPLGLLYIAATLREKGFWNVFLLDMAGHTNAIEIKDAIQSIPLADIYGISCLSTNYCYAKQIVKHIQVQYPTAFTFLGGVHPSSMPDVTLSDLKVDAVVVGEGEDVFCDLVGHVVNGKEVHKIILGGGGRDDIDSYPYPARNLINIFTYSRRLEGQQVISLISSRGCVHNCIHCNSIVMGGGNKSVRYRSSDNIIKEIKTLRDSFTYYRFNDDHFTGNPNLTDLLIRIEQLNIKFRIFARIEDLNEATCKLLKKAGCIHVAIGLESLNSDNLRIIGKINQSGKEGNIKIARECGLVVRASFIVGLPYDNEKTINDFFKKASKLEIDEFAIYPLIPYPGTMIWKNPQTYGYTIINSDFTDYVQMGKNGKTCYALKHKNFTPKDIKNWIEIATKILEDGGSKHMSTSKIAR